MAEEKDERRNFLGPDNITSYYIAAPTAQDIRGADWNYSKTYTNSLVEGITTSAEMMDILMRRGIIGPEFEQRAQELSDNLSALVSKLENSDNMEEKRELSYAVANAREELFQWNQRLNGPMANTCEQIADDARLEYLTSCIVQDKEGNRVWDSYDSYLKEKSQGLALRARFEVMLYLQGLDSDFLERTPEAVAIREVNEEAEKREIEAAKMAAIAEEEAASEAAEEAEEDTKTKKTKKKTTSKKSNKDKKDDK